MKPLKGDPTAIRIPVCIVCFHKHPQYRFVRHLLIPAFGLMANLACMAFYLVGPFPTSVWAAMIIEDDRFVNRYSNTNDLRISSLSRVFNRALCRAIKFVVREPPFRYIIMGQFVAIARLELYVRNRWNP